MVISNLGTLNGKIKAVIADAGFSCYKVYEMSMSQIIPIVKPKNNLKLDRVIKAMPVNFDWLDSKYSSVFDDLVKDLNEIIIVLSKTIYTKNNKPNTWAESEFTKS